MYHGTIYSNTLRLFIVILTIFSNKCAFSLATLYREVVVTLIMDMVFSVLFFTLFSFSTFCSGKECEL